MQVATAPDGNGGVYRALEATGAIAHMVRHGVAHLDCYSVDNVLARPCDPEFLGACVAARAPLGARVVAKATPGERVGVFARCASLWCLLHVRPTLIGRHQTAGLYTVHSEGQRAPRAVQTCYMIVVRR